MINLPAELVEAFARKISQQEIPDSYHNFYLKWLQFYLDFCHKYGFSSSDPQSLNPFLEKLQAKKQSQAFQRQAHHSVALYHELLIEQGEVAAPASAPSQSKAPPRELPTQAAAASPLLSLEGGSATPPSLVAGDDRQGSPPPPEPLLRDLQNATCEPLPTTVDVPAIPAIAQWQKAAADLAAEIKVRHYSPKTLKSYSGWVRKFQLFTRNKEILDISPADVKEYMKFLAVTRKVSASSQEN